MSKHDGEPFAKNPKAAAEAWLDTHVIEMIAGPGGPPIGPTVRTMLTSMGKEVELASMAYASGYAAAISDVADYARSQLKAGGVDISVLVDPSVAPTTPQ